MGYFDLRAGGTEEVAEPVGLTSMMSPEGSSGFRLLS